MITNFIGLLLFAGYAKLTKRKHNPSYHQKAIEDTMTKNTRTHAPKAAQSKSHFYDTITLGLMELVEPYVAAVDAVPASRQSESADTGHEKPSTQDRNLKFLLGTFLSYADRQLNGPIRTKDGKTYDCAMEMLNKNERRLTEIEREIETGKDADGRQITTQGRIKLFEEIESRLYYKNRNEAWVDVLSGLIGAMNTVHDEVFNEMWKPTRVESTSDFQKKDASEIEALNKEYLAKLKASRAA